MFVVLMNGVLKLEIAREEGLCPRRVFWVSKNPAFVVLCLDNEDAEFGH